ncbi:MAG: type II secretion system protein N [Pseudomonadota bacterium]
MRVFGLSFLFVIVLFVTLIATMPLGFVLDRAPMQRLGVRWSGTSGTIYSGQINGVVAGAQSIGDIAIRLDPMDLVNRKISYFVEWTGVPGSGTAGVSVGRDSVAISDLNASIDIEPLVGLAGELRRIGGTASIRSGEVLFVRDVCVEASGQVTTNVLGRAAASYGQTGSDLVGILSCDGSMLNIPLSGSVSGGDTVDAQIRVGLSEPSSFSSSVKTTNPELSALLLLRGFERVGDMLSYNRTVQIGGA